MISFFVPYSVFPSVFRENGILGSLHVHVYMIVHVCACYLCTHPCHERYVYVMYIYMYMCSKIS